MSWIPAVISAVGSIVGGAQQNSANSSASRRSREWTQEQRATAYQTATQSMRAAGINPMLAYKNNPNAGGGAQPIAAQNTTSNVANAISSAMALRRQQKELDMLDSQIAKTKHESQNLSTLNIMTQAQANMATEDMLVRLARQPGLMKAARAESNYDLATIDRIGATFNGMLDGANSAKSLITPSFRSKGRLKQ